MSKLSLALLILVSILADTDFAQSKKSDREKDGLIGPVSTIYVHYKMLIKEYGKYAEGPELLSHVVKYDTEGHLIEHTKFLPGGIPDTKTTSKYDSKGNEVEFASYVHDSLTFKWIATYDVRGRVLERIYDSDGKTICKYNSNGTQGECVSYRKSGSVERKWVSTFDTRGNETERKNYSPDGSLNDRYVYAYDLDGNKTLEAHFYKHQEKLKSSKHVYVYDAKGNLIKDSLFFDDAPDSKKTHRYDEKGNKIEEAKYNGDGSVKEKAIFTYEFDSTGNWVRAIITEQVRDSDKSTSERVIAAYRKIIFFGNDKPVAARRY